MKRLSLTVKTLIAAALVLSASSCSEKAAETTTPAAVELPKRATPGKLHLNRISATLMPIL